MPGMLQSTSVFCTNLYVHALNSCLGPINIPPPSPTQIENHMAAQDSELHVLASSVVTVCKC